MEYKRGTRRQDRHTRRRELLGNKWPGRASAAYCWPPGTFINGDRNDRMYHSLNHIMTSDEVILLTLLIGLRETMDKPGKLHPRYRATGWIWCSTGLLWRELGWNQAKQRRVFCKLEENGFAERALHRKRDPENNQVGPEKVRWVRINQRRVEEAIAEHHDDFDFERYGGVTPDTA